MGRKESNQTNIYKPAHKILVLVPYSQIPPLNADDDVSRKAQGPTFGLSLLLLSYLLYARRGDSGETVHMCRLV